MAIKAGITIAEAIRQLTKGFQKVMGRKPDGLEKIKIQQEAVRRTQEVNKVVDMQGNIVDTSKGIMGGRQIQDSPEFGKKIKETYDAAKGPGKGQEMVDALKSPGAKKSYKIMEDQLGMKLYGDETFDEILEIQKTGKHPRGEPKADGGRIGYKDGPELSDFIDVQASGSKSGKQQIIGAPEGITMDQESINAIVKADIPISQKIDLLAKYQYGKGRTRIERDDSEVFLDEGGFKSRDIGFGFNKSALSEGGDGEGIGGTLLYNMETGEPQFNIGFKKKFADGGRIGFADGPDKPGRRKFIKTAVGIASMLPFGIGKGVKMAAPAIKKAAELTGPALDKIIEVVMSSGKLISQSGRRLKELTTKKKLKDIEVEEDMMDQSYTIKTKDKTIYYKPGKQDEMGFDDDIIEVVEDAITKKASGGVARMLGE
jgi:hypothetical protein|tara:strand:+ start:79 stop:1362 length:1284 start_codon:yes stop_codon:yes gene_type:complete